MPRKSTSSHSAADGPASFAANVEAAAGSNLDGDTSMLSVATDASTTNKPRVNGKAAKEDPDSVGVDVCLELFSTSSKRIQGFYFSTETCSAAFSPPRVIPMWFTLANMPPFLYIGPPTPAHPNLSPRPGHPSRQYIHTKRCPARPHQSRNGIYQLSSSQRQRAHT
jgi:hypothetical protein